MTINVGNLQAADVSPTEGTSGRVSESGGPIDLSALSNALVGTGKLLNADRKVRAAAAKDASIGSATVELNDALIDFQTGRSTEEIMGIAGADNIDASQFTETELASLSRAQQIRRSVDLARKQGKSETASDLVLRWKAGELARRNPAIAKEIFAAAGVTSEDLQEDLKAEEELNRQIFQDDVKRKALVLSEAGFTTAELSPEQVLLAYEQNFAKGDQTVASLKRQADLLAADTTLTEAERKNQYVRMVNSEVPDIARTQGAKITAVLKTDNLSIQDKFDAIQSIRTELLTEIATRGLTKDEADKAFGPLLDIVTNAEQVVSGDKDVNFLSNQVQIMQKLSDLEFAKGNPELFRIGRIAEQNRAFGDAIINNTSTVDLLAKAVQAVNEDFGVPEFFPDAENMSPAQVRTTARDVIGLLESGINVDNPTPEESAYIGRVLDGFLSSGVHNQTQAAFDTILPFLADERSAKLELSPEIAAQVSSKARSAIPAYLSKLDNSLTARIQKEAGAGNLKVSQTDTGVVVEFARTDLRPEQLDVPLSQLKESIGELNKRIDWAIKAYAYHAADPAFRGDLAHAKQRLFGDLGGQNGTE